MKLLFAPFAMALILAAALFGSAAAGAAEPLSVAEVAPGVFVHKGVYEDVNAKNKGDIANIGFVIGETGVAVIDTGNSLVVGQALRAAVKAKTNLPILFVINTHVHPDHIFGNAAFKDDKPEFVGHAKLAAAMLSKAPYYLQTLKTFAGEAAAAGIEVIPPTKTVKAGETIALDLGGRSLSVTGYAVAHTDTDVTVLDSKTATLWTGDLLFVDRVPAIDGSMLGWLKVIPQLRQVAAARAIPGHGPETVPWPQALDAEERYFNVLLRDIRKIQSRHGTLEEAMKTAGAEEQGKWALFDDYNQRNVTEAFVELEWE